MNKYNESKIYKIVCNITGDVYVGSTTQTLHQRLIKHKSDAKRCRDVSSCVIINRGDYKIELIENISCDNRKELNTREGYWQSKIKCVNKRQECRTNKQWREDNKERYEKKNKEYYEKNKERLLEYRKEYREKNKEVLSAKKKIYREKNRDMFIQKSKKFYADNKEESLKKSKIYYEKNKEVINKQKKEYYRNHKEEAKAYNIKYRQDNKEQLKQKKRDYYQKTKHLRKPAIKCECGGTYEDTASKKTRHEKTKKHISFYSN